MTAPRRDTAHAGPPEYSGSSAGPGSIMPQPGRWWFGHAPDATPASSGGDRSQRPMGRFAEMFGARAPVDPPIGVGIANSQRVGSRAVPRTPPLPASGVTALPP
jgi:hypothetical protein